MKTNKNTCSFVMLGTGNLAYHLTSALKAKGYELKQVYGRDRKKSRDFAKKFNSTFTNNLSEIPEADLYFLCVKDDAIAPVANELNVKSGIVIHCSGSTPLSALNGSSKNIAVFYPLSTYSKNDKINFSEIPVFIEGNTAVSEKKLADLGKNLCGEVIKMKSAQREKLHLAAVMSSNFSNFLFTLSDEYLKKEKAGKFNYLLPLLQRTIAKLESNDSLSAQTGPARRKDSKVMKRHLELLKNYPEQKKLYKLLSSGISSRYTTTKK